jgi:hypothetical protein
LVEKYLYYDITHKGRKGSGKHKYRFGNLPEGSGKDKYKFGNSPEGSGKDK